VVDDCNAMGYPGINWDIDFSKYRTAWREHDWHNGSRRAVADKIKPDLILGCVDRATGVSPDPYQQSDRWHLVPHPVNTARFHPGNGQERPFSAGLYGMTGQCYQSRTSARRVLCKHGGGWVPQHGGYWRDGRGSKPNLTYYNDELAAALRKVMALWVDGSDYNVLLSKYFEGAASGCVLLGERPYGWEEVIPPEVDPLIECTPDEFPEAAASVTEEQRQAISAAIFPYLEEHHSIPARANQIMQLLEEYR